MCVVKPYQQSVVVNTKDVISLGLSSVSELERPCWLSHVREARKAHADRAVVSISYLSRVPVVPDTEQTLGKVPCLLGDLMPHLLTARGGWYLTGAL